MQGRIIIARVLFDWAKKHRPEFGLFKFQPIGYCIRRSDGEAAEVYAAPLDYPELELDQWIATNVFKLGQHVGLKKRGLWYRTGAKGYTADETEAGRFTVEDARQHEHVTGAPDDVFIVPFPTPRYSAGENFLELHVAVSRFLPMMIYPVEGAGFRIVGTTYRAEGATLPLALAMFAHKAWETHWESK